MIQYAQLSEPFPLGYVAKPMSLNLPFLKILLITQFCPYTTTLDKLEIFLYFYFTQPQPQH